MDPAKVSLFKTYEKPRGQGGAGSFATFMIVGRKFPPYLARVLYELTFFSNILLPRHALLVLPI
jgi:hypothetical protein